MDTTETLFTALVAAQKQFTPVVKRSVNPHFKSRYADLASCVEAIRNALNANGIYLLQKTLDCAEGVAVETLLIHISGASLSGGVLRIPATKQDAHGYCSALTYARRVSLLATCGVAPEDDDDGNAAVGGLTHEMADHLAAVEASTPDTLSGTYGAALNAAKANPSWQRKVIEAKNLAQKGRP